VVNGRGVATTAAVPRLLRAQRDANAVLDTVNPDERTAVE
jgi:hypothetical protein